MKVLVRFGFLSPEDLSTSWGGVKCVSLDKFSGDSVESKIVSYLESELGNYLNPLEVADIQHTPIGGYFIPLYESTGGLFESVEIVLLDSLAEGQVFFCKGEGDD